MSAFNGSGTFVISGVGLPYVTGTTISSTVANQLNTDLATGLSNCITKDGQTTPTANIPMGSHKITGLSAPTTAGDALSWGAAGNLSQLGIGMTASNILDITQTQNAQSAMKLLNASTGTGAYCSAYLGNASHNFQLSMFGTGFTTSGANRQDGALLLTDGAGGMTFSVPSDAFRWYVGAINYLGLTAAGLTGPGWAISHDLGSGSSFQAAGFGVTSVLSGGGLLTTGGNFDVVNTSNGVRLASGATSWAAVSDYRAKKVAGSFTDSGKIIDAVPVHLAALKTQPENSKAMFLAHEVQAAIPYAVHGEKDGEKMQVLESTDPLVPILWAELRDVRARLAAAGL